MSIMWICRSLSNERMVGLRFQLLRYVPTGQLVSKMKKRSSQCEEPGLPDSTHLGKMAASKQR